ncbi:18087_t:CDS:2 [Acaulospora morrowiae]|uniref:18087_t:CDS:1 n=1 Tax=Acaulospora morrowiae TaxID=94023 RepID=A0A9N9BGC7_9GLOM|nr:18087_t:CDS:2 [Acaulospora morrowiae]
MVEYDRHPIESPPAMTEAELVEISFYKPLIFLTNSNAARQRTFEGAYWRTCLASFGFSMLILRIFERSFYGIGVLFVAFGGVILVISYYRRQSNMDVFDNSKPFVTSGRYVALTGIAGLATYLTLLILIVKL